MSKEYYRDEIRKVLGEIHTYSANVKLIGSEGSSKHIALNETSIDVLLDELNNYKQLLQEKNLLNVKDKSRGLFEKYTVDRIDGKPLKGGALVLEWGDTNAHPAIRAYSRSVRDRGYTQLSDDIDQLLDAIK